jgi:site-specific DNA-methyltransferase (adenine-specific)
MTAPAQYQEFLEQKRIVQPKIRLFNDNFQNYKSYGIPAKAQLVIADIPYNLGNNAYASSPTWYIDGDNKNGESSKAGKQFFNTDNNFNIAEYFHFCSKLLKNEPKEKGQAPAMIVFCSFQQIPLIESYGKKHGFNKSYPLFFIKNYSAQVLKANMKIVGATENAIVLYRDKLPKFNNNKKMIFNWFEWQRDDVKIYPKIHPTQKPVNVLKRLIEIFTDEGDTVIDPCAGSGTTLRACAELNRNCYGFEVDKRFYKEAVEKMININDSTGYLKTTEAVKRKESLGIPLFDEVCGNV